MTTTTTSSHSCCATSNVASTGTFVDPICGMRVEGGPGSLQMEYEGTTYYFCSKHCVAAFRAQKNGMVTVNGKNRSILWGAVGTIGLLLVFFAVVTLSAPTILDAGYQFARLWYWVLLLSLGFGFQLGLFVHIRHQLKQLMAGATAEVATSGAVTTGSMIACCSHGLVNLLPMLGVSAAAAFLTRYQLPFILLGVFSNLVGITMMLGIAQKHNVEMSPFLNPLVRMNMKAVRGALIAAGILTIAVTAISV